MISTCLWALYQTDGLPKFGVPDPVSAHQVCFSLLICDPVRLLERGFGPPARNGGKKQKIISSSLKNPRKTIENWEMAQKQGCGGGGELFEFFGLFLSNELMLMWLKSKEVLTVLLKNHQLVSLAVIAHASQLKCCRQSNEENILQILVRVAFVFHVIF